MHIVTTTDSTITFAPRTFGGATELFRIASFEERVSNDSGSTESTSCVVSEVAELESVDVTLSITDEETNVTTTETVAASRDVNYLVINPTYTFEENRYYTFRVVRTNELYRGKIYVTDQTDLEKFSINNGEFTYYEEGTDNQYIYR